MGAGETVGYFVQTLVGAGLICPDVRRQPDCPEEALGLAVNQCIVRSSTVRGVFNVIRDLLPVFDTVNTATSMHRVAKTGKYDKVRHGPSDCLLPRSCSRMMRVALLNQSSNTAMSCGLPLLQLCLCELACTSSADDYSVSVPWMMRGMHCLRCFCVELCVLKIYLYVRCQSEASDY